MEKQDKNKLQKTEIYKESKYKYKTSFSLINLLELGISWKNYRTFNIGLWRTDISTVHVFDM